MPDPTNLPTEPQAQAGADPLENLQGADLLAALRAEALALERGEVAAPGEVPVEVPAEPGEQPPEPGDEPIEPGEEPGEHPPEPPEPEPEHVPERIRLKHLPKSERAQLNAASELVREKGITLAEALRQVGLATPQSAPAETSPAEKPAPIDPLAQSRAKLDALQTQLDTAVDEYDTDAQKRLQREILEATRELTRAEFRAETAQATTATAKQSAEAKAIAEVEGLYPSFNEVGSALNKASLARIAWLETHNPAAFDDPEWAHDVAAYAARKTGISPKAAAPAAAAPANTRVPARTAIPAGMTPGSASRAGSPGSTQAATLQAALTSDDPKVLLAALKTVR